MTEKSDKYFLFISIGSMLLLYGIFFVFPLTVGIVGSFADWHPLKGQFNFIGIDNYIELMQDDLFWKSIKNTMYFTLICTIATTGLGLILAVLVTKIKRGQGIFKSAIYLPYVTSIMVISVVWRWIFLAQGGLLNNILAALGLQGLDWLNSSTTVMPSLMLMTIWHDVGFALIIYIAGISEIPKSFYEAAEIDGANSFQIFCKITIPSLAPTTVLVAVTNMITYIQVYDQVFSLTKGGPGDASYTASFYLFRKALGSYRFGYASATSMVLLMIIMGFSILQMKLIMPSEK